MPVSQNPNVKPGLEWDTNADLHAFPLGENNDAFIFKIQQRWLCITKNLNLGNLSLSLYPSKEVCIFFMWKLSAA